MNKKIAFSIGAAVVVLLVVVLVVVFSKRQTPHTPSTNTRTVEDLQSPVSEWLNLAPNGRDYTFKFPAVWHVMEGDSNVDVFVTNGSRVTLDPKYPTTVIVGVSSQTKPAPVTLDAFVKAMVPASDKATIKVTTGTTKEGAAMVKIVSGKAGLNEQVLYGVELGSEVVFLEAHGYIQNIALDEIAQSVKHK